MTRDPRLLVGGTVGALLVVVPLAVLVALVLTGNATDVGGLVVLAMCAAAGGYVLLDVRRRARDRPPPVLAEDPRARRPAAVVGWTLALLVVGPVVIAVVLSLVDDGLRGDPVRAEVVVWLVVTAVVAAVGWAVRLIVRGRRRR